MKLPETLLIIRPSGEFLLVGVIATACRAELQRLRDGFQTPDGLAAARRIGRLISEYAEEFGEKQPERKPPKRQLEVSYLDERVSKEEKP